MHVGRITALGRVEEVLLSAVPRARPVLPTQRHAHFIQGSAWDLDVRTHASVLDYPMHFSVTGDDSAEQIELFNVPPGSVFVFQVAAHDA